MAFDMVFVENACDLLIRTSKTSDPTSSIALWISAVVVYARCFGTDPRSRPPLPDEIQATMTSVERAFHRRMMRERDKYVAHVEFSRSEVTQIERLTKATDGAVVGHKVQYTMQAPALGDVTALRDLAAGLCSVIGARLHPQLADIPKPSSGG